MTWPEGIIKLHKESFVVDDEMLKIVRKEIVFESITRKGLEICFQFVKGHGTGVICVFFNMILLFIFDLRSAGFRSFFDFF